MSNMNQGGFNADRDTHRQSTPDMWGNLIKVENDQYIQMCCICGEKLKETLCDGSVNTFVLVFAFKEDDKIKEFRKILPVCKSCYHSHYKMMGSIIDHYKEDFFIEGI